MDVQTWKRAQAAEAGYWSGAGESIARVLHELAEDSEVLAEELPKVLEGRSVRRALEIGVGPLGIGFLAAYAHSLTCEITAVEPLPIQEITVDDPELRTYAQALQHRVLRHQGVGESLPFEVSSFDLVCCVNVLDHTADPEQVLRETLRVTRPGGIFALCVDTRSVAAQGKWQVVRRTRRSQWYFEAHPHSWMWDTLHGRLSRDWVVLWCDRPARGDRLLGHMRLSTWILQRP
jgi:SAM-dependent methyltransferase